MRSEVVLLLALAAVALAGRSRRALPAVCNLPRDSGSCGGDIEGYYFNTQTGQCEMFRYGGCGGNGNHFSSERACARACECRADPPPQPRGLVRANPSFCDRTCPQACDCSGDTVRCRGQLDSIPQGISRCAKTIDLSNTGIQSVPEGAFSGLSSATHLDLSGNNLRCLTENAFQGLTSLETLRLGNNQLLQIPADILQTLPSLQTVELQNNMLTFMACETIDNLPDLKLVNVSNNQLMRLIPHPGTPLGQMTIDVSGNKLSSFSVPLAPGSDGPTLLLRDNPWVCDCRLEQLIAHYARRQDQVLDGNFARCSKPSRAANQPLLFTNPDNMECLPREPDTVGIIDICQLAADAGPCLASQTRYYYDPNRRSCRQFTYGGCLGNENNFASAESCERHCVDIASRPSDEPVTMVPDRTPPPTCGANEEYQDCGTSCEDTCAEPAQFCLEFCVKGCFCREGYIRQNENGRCIREEECDPESPTRPATTDPLTAPQWPSPPHVLNLLTQDKIALRLPSVPEANPRSTFDIEYRTPTSSWQRVPGNPSITQPQLPVDNLQPNTPYTFRVRYYDPARREESPWSRVETITTDRPDAQPLPTPVWDRNPDTPSTRQIDVFLPPYDIPGAVYDVVYQQRPNGPLIPAGTVPTDSRDPIPFTISGLQPGTPYQLFLTARVGPRRSDRSRPLDTRTTDDTPTQPSAPDSPVWPQPNNPSDVLPNEFTLRLPSGQPSTVVYDVIDSDTGRVVNSFPSNSPRRQTFPGIPSQIYRYGIRARDPVSDQRSPVTSELRFLTPPEWPQPGNPVDEQPDSITVRLPSARRGITYEVIDQDTNRVLGTYQPGTSRQQQLPARPGRTYRLGIRSRDGTGLVSPIVSELTARTSQPTEAPLPKPVWTQRGSPSQRFVELSLPPYQVPNSVYTVYYESDRTPKQSAGTGQPGNPFRVTGLDPGTEYRFFVVASNGGRTSPESEPLPERTSEISTQPTQEVVTRTQRNRYIVTWTISPSLEPLVESFMIRYRPERPDGSFGPWVVEDPAVPKEDRTYDLSFPAGGRYQVEVLAQPLNLEAFKAIVDIDGAVISPDKDAVPDAPDTVAPPQAPDAPVWPRSGNPANVQPNSVTVTLPNGQPFDIVYEVIDTSTGRVLGSYTANSPRQQQFSVSPDQVYRFGIRARDPSTGQTSPTSSVLSFNSPSEPTEGPSPATAPSEAAWPENPLGSVTADEFTVNLPAIPPTYLYDIFELVGRSYVRLRTAPGNGSPQQLTFPRKPNQSVLFRIFNTVSREATSLSAPVEVTAPSQPTQPTGGDIPSSGLITFPAPRQGQSQFVIRNSITGEVARLSSTTQTFALPISTFPVGPQEITVETERGEVLVRYQLVVPEQEITPPSWPRNNPVSRTDNSITVQLPAAVSGYNYQLVREFPDGRTQVIGTYTSGDSRQQTVSVTPGEQYRFGLRSVSTSDSTAFSRALSFIQVTTEIPVPNWQSPNPISTAGNSVTVRLPSPVSGYNYQIIRRFPDGRSQVIGTYTSSDSRQQTLSVTPGVQHTFGLRSVSTSDSSIFSRTFSFIQVTTASK